MTHTTVSIIVVNFNAGMLLEKCVRAALASTARVEVIVVDNGSGDGSIYHLRQQVNDKRLTIIENFANLGFARAVNIGLDQSLDDFALLLNPDCIICPDTLAKMLHEMQTHPEAGIAGCLIRNRDGSEQAGCRRRVPTPWRSVVRTFHLERVVPNHPKFESIVMHHQPLPSRPVYEEAISGAFMLARRTAINDVGPMDEGYFLHCEDLDWCMRFRQKGWKILFVPYVEVLHEKGRCSANRPIRVEWHKHKGMTRFYRKFFRHQYSILLMVCVITGVWLRFLVLTAYLSLQRFKS